MQLGTRWSVGATPPTGVPSELASGVGEVEAGLPDHAATWRWTLTWLEGRPIAELDDGTRVFLGSDGTARVELPAD